jgi:DNA-binding IclR family transcriptional regulator
MTTTKKTKEQVQSVKRSLDILEFLCQREAEIREIAEGVGLSKSTTHRLIKTLEENGYVYQSDKSSKYYVSLKIFSMAQKASTRIGGIRRQARPHLERVAALTKESVYLVIREGLEVLYVDCIESPHLIRAANQTGDFNPLHCTASGKIFLAYDTVVRKKILDGVLQPYTELTITDPSVLEQGLKQIYSKGYAIDKGERFDDVVAVAVPVFNYAGEIIASILVAGPTERMIALGIDEITVNLIKEAQKLSNAFGCLTVEA